jgi:hypothetical protein
MKQLYIISVQMDGLEESIYFAEMTEQQAHQVRSVLRRAGMEHSVQAIRKSPGFNSFGALMKDFEDMASG